MMAGEIPFGRHGRSWRLSALLPPLLGLLTTVPPPAAAAPECTLVSLILRYEDSPIDLEPAFDPQVTSYTVRLDWSYEAFSIDARPDTGCQVDGVPTTPRAVPIGDSTEVILFARHPETGEKKEYMLTAYRRLGSETELRSLTVEGGVLSPPFDEKRREYHVKVELSRDVARIVYGLSDNEQRISGSAGKERQTGAPRVNKTALLDEAGQGGAEGREGNQSRSNDTEANASNATVSDDESSRRLHPMKFDVAAASLASSGEIQFRTSSMDFLLDVGYSRSVELTVQCADPMRASLGTYTLHLERPGCTPERPFFHPEKNECVNFCSSAYYRNHETNRCSHCNENCKICSGLLDCQMCTPDTSDYTYAVQPDGKCRAQANHLFQKYRWWSGGLGVLLSFLLLLGCCALCQYYCSTGKESKRTGKFSSIYDSDDEDHQPSRARYAANPGRLARY